MSKNIDLKVVKNQLVVTIDLAQEYGYSKSGKSLVIASTQGNISIPDNDLIKIGLTCYAITPKK